MLLLTPFYNQFRYYWKKIDVIPNIRCGIDIVYIPRFELLLKDPSFKARIFSAEESLLPLKSLAGNFAIKESFIKACLNETTTIDFSALEVRRNENGAPYLYSNSSELNKVIKNVISISISHDTDYCIGILLASFETA